MRWPEDYNVEVSYKVYNEISKFYDNVGLKYLHTYSFKEIDKLIKEHIKSISNINHTKLISNPILEKWKGYGRVVIGKWNFALDIKDNKVIVVDACHQQNMANKKTVAELFEEDLSTQVPRITHITLPSSRENRHFIHCKIDGERQPMKVIHPNIYKKYKNGEMTLYQLAERCYAKELNENRFELDQFLNRSRKI